MKRVLVSLLLFAGAAVAQIPDPGASFPFQSAITTDSYVCNLPKSESVKSEALTCQPAIEKECAFGLTRQTIDATDYRPNDVASYITWMISAENIVPKTPSELAFPAPQKSYMVTPPTRDVCPYERAIELFGEDRVEFNSCVNAVNRTCPWTNGCTCHHGVLVDGEMIYEESAPSTSDKGRKGKVR